VLLEVPWPVVHELLAAQDRASRQFATALWTDTVRALEHAQRPVVSMTAHSHPEPVGSSIPGEEKAA
jgi:hypothetical protein